MDCEPGQRQCLHPGHHSWPGCPSQARTGSGGLQPLGRHEFHDIDLDCPLHPKNLEDLKSVLCILTCINGTDAAGLAISTDCECWNMDSPLATPSSRVARQGREILINLLPTSMHRSKAGVEGQGEGMREVNPSDRSRTHVLGVEHEQSYSCTGHRDRLEVSSSCSASALILGMR